MTHEYLFRLFAVMHGAFTLGLIGFMFLYYISHYRKEDYKSRTLLKIGFSFAYSMLTIATIRTALYSMYERGDIWYWIVIFGWTVGDICAVYLFRLYVKNRI